ncbi:MAG TPA: class I SAM-dependent methyltransferase [Terriglobales bacterium]
MTREIQASVPDDWDRHWNDYSRAAQRNPAQQYRRHIIFSLLALPESGAGVRILDVGSGQGDMAAAIRSAYPQAEIIGLELSHSGVEISRHKVPAARFLECNLLNEIQPADDLRGWATHAICSEVIEHVDDPVTLLRNARLYMAPGCELVITAPGGPMSAFDKHIGHRRHFRPADIEAVFREAGFLPRPATGAGFPFFNLYRCFILVRGRKLIADVSAEENPTLSWTARAAMAVFDSLFCMNVDSSAWGWQMVGKGQVPDERRDS